MPGLLYKSYANSPVVSALSKFAIIIQIDESIIAFYCSVL